MLLKLPQTENLICKLFKPRVCKRHFQKQSRGREAHKGSNQEYHDVLEGSATTINNIFNEITTTLVEWRMGLNATTHESEENKRAMEAMKHETNASFERFDKLIVEINSQGPPTSLDMQGHDGVETSVTASLYESLR